ncbi:hypothetical protein SH668x_001009 [Planctomicrobium sp. SH668]|uniref:hypothetical protein n=1 Tax=Planctomicrobium sp. SH668 TaxID=3448126 RepID=UPI003F5AF56E
MMDDAHHLRADMIMISSSIRKGWPVPAEKIKDARRKATAIINNTDDHRLKATALKLIKTLELYLGEDPTRD